MRKDIGMRIIVAGILISVFAAAYFIIVPNLPTSNVDLRLGDGIFSAKIATNESDRANGLTGVSEMSARKALIMAYPESSKWPISMKDMKVPVDIVWLNSQKKVVHIVKNASPDAINPKTFTPKTAASYVIELPAGSVDSKAISTETTAIFQISADSVR